LAARFGVSRGPVREALRLLESLNLVRVLPRRGAFVIAPDDEELLQLLTIRTVLFALTCELAAKAIDKGGAKRLKQQILRLVELSADAECSPRRFQNAEYDIAETLCDIAGIPRLTDMQRELTLGAAVAYGHLAVATQDMRVLEARLFNAVIKAVCAGRAEEAFATARKLNDEGIARGVALAALAPRQQPSMELRGRRIRRQ